MSPEVTLFVKMGFDLIIPRYQPKNPTLVDAAVDDETIAGKTPLYSLNFLEKNGNLPQKGLVCVWFLGQWLIACLCNACRILELLLLSTPLILAANWRFLGYQDRRELWRFVGNAARTPWISVGDGLGVGGWNLEVEGGRWRRIYGNGTVEGKETPTRWRKMLSFFLLISVRRNERTGVCTGN